MTTWQKNSTQRTPFIIFILMLLVSACIEELASDPVLLDPSSESVTSELSEWFTVYFSEPNSPESQSLRGGPDAELAAAILRARASIDIALYDLNLWSIRDALIQAHRNGVVVRVVAESDNLDQDEFQDLKLEGIPVLGDRHEALMHHKFIVIDHYQVWTGSMNMTLNGAYHNNNNLLMINSSKMAENYLVEFEEMFEDDLFGNASPNNTPNPIFKINGTVVEVFFSPEDDMQDRIVELIDNAQESVYIMAFALTADPISDALFEAHERGLNVAGVVETRQSNNMGSDYQTLFDLGLNIVLDENTKNMHHKVIIIDEKVVITGSYNFSRSAEDRNDENSLIIHSAEIAELYLEEFYKVY